MQQIIHYLSGTLYVATVNCNINEYIMICTQQVNQKHISTSTIHLQITHNESWIQIKLEDKNSYSNWIVVNIILYQVLWPHLNLAQQYLQI